MWTDTPGVLIGIAAADCVPVLVVDPDGPIGAAHAGWQGTSLRIASGLVEALVAAGAKRERLVASIGPSIGPCCYAIDAERADLIQERIGADSLVRADGRIVFFEEKPEQPRSTLTGIALYFYPGSTLPLVQRYLAEGNNPDQPGRLVQWLYPQAPVYTWLVPGIWYDIGSRETLEEADRVFSGTLPPQS